MKHKLQWAWVLVLVMVPVTMAFAGGWATITVKELPEYVVAGQPTELAFTIRQHGVSPLDELAPVIEAKNGKDVVKAAARPGRGPGEYEAEFTLAEAGDWKVTIHSGFGDGKLTLMPLRAIAKGAPAPLALSEFDRGQRLFVAKGCVTCHVHKALPGSGQVEAGPELTVPRLARDYVKKFLADPSATPPRGEMRMPNLHLGAKEIDALVAFVNGEKATK